MIQTMIHLKSQENQNQHILSMQKLPNHRHLTSMANRLINLFTFYSLCMPHFKILNFEKRGAHFKILNFENQIIYHPLI